MPGLDFLKKKIAEKGKAAPSAKFDELKGIEAQAIDMNRVEQIVKKMKKKYRAEGIEFEEVGGRLKELRGIIAEGRAAQLEVQKVEELRETKSPLIKMVGGIYLRLRSIMEPVSKIASRMPQMQTLAFHLYSANMRYSVKQYLALAVTGAAIIFFVTLGITTFLMSIFEIPLAITVLAVPVISLFAAVFSLSIILLIPKQRAKVRGDEISVELPFALRHMATELRAGIGLYRTIQAIATAGYGVLSEEFARTITEIEEGTDTKDALSHLAARTQSRALRSALMHVIRALKTGGNLSDIMNEIAEDVSFELRMKTRDFAARMNFFGVIFIFSAIVLPVVISILGGIRNSPLGAGGGISFKDLLPLGPEVIAAIYLVALPMLLGLFIIYIMMSQPKV
jgi:flagellar protein FlaJ